MVLSPIVLTNTVLFLHGLFADIYASCITICGVLWPHPKLPCVPRYQLESENQMGHIEESISRTEVLRRHERAYSCLFLCHEASGCHLHSPFFPPCTQDEGCLFYLVKSIILKSCHRAQIHLTVNQWWLLKHPAVLSDYVSGNKHTRFPEHSSHCQQVNSNSKNRRKKRQSSLTWKTQICHVFLLPFYLLAK